LVLRAALLALLGGCGGSMMTGPGGQASGGGNGGGMGGNGGGMGGGGGVGAGGPAPTTTTVTTGNDFFRSDRNATVNTAVDTVAAGGTVTWRWVNTGLVPHSVQSLGAPSFASGPVATGDGSTYQVTFSAPGRYAYNCAIHGNLMTGTIVVLAP
jgi:plastocyanin